MGGLVPVAPVAVEELAFAAELEELELFLPFGGCFDGGGCSGSLL